MPNLTETADWVEGLYRLETTDPVLGGEEGIDNVQAKTLGARTRYLKAQLEALAAGSQPLDADLTAIAALISAADKMPYATGAGAWALTTLSAFARALLDDADAATARATLGAASPADVAAAIAALVDTSPATLDTLNELAAALGDDANFAATMTAALALKAPLDSPALTGVPTAPTAAPGTATTQLATTAFVSAAITGGDFKDSVRVASTANIAALTGLLTIDGVVLVAGDRVLVKDQGTGADNGIYVAAAGAWARATDADTGAELSPGATIPVEAGTVNADTQWTLTTDGTVTIGTTALVFAKRDVADASTTVKGKVQLATSAEAQALTDALKAITPATLAAALQGSNQSLGAAGYQKLPGGVIVQWGNNTFASGGSTIMLPVAFSGTNYRLGFATQSSPISPVLNSRTASTFNASGFATTTGAAAACTTDWVAIGS